MKKIILIPALVALVITVLAPVSGVIIKPGVYKLQWCNEDTGPPIPLIAKLQRLDHPQSLIGMPRLKGAVSARAYVGQADRLFWIVLDESKGTGKGYDTAYLTLYTPTKQIDLAKATRVQMVTDPTLRSDRSSKVFVDVPLREGLGVKHKALVDIGCQLKQPDEKDVTFEMAWVYLHGHWAGSLKTDSGDLKIRLFDGNLNGTYNDRCRTEAQGDFTVGDGLLPCDVMVMGEEGGIEALSDIISTDGRLYEPIVSRTGETIEIKRYAGPVGKVRLMALDGYGCPIDCETWSFFNARGGFAVGCYDYTTLPAGGYTLQGILIRPTDRIQGNMTFWLATRDKRRVRVPKGKAVTIPTGGRLKIAIAPSKTALRAWRGSEVDLMPRLTVGGSPASISSGGIPTSLTIKDMRGKTVATDKITLIDNPGISHRFRLPATLLSGIYTLAVTVDPRPYQDPMTVVKKLIVTE